MDQLTLTLATFLLAWYGLLSAVQIGYWLLVFARLGRFRSPPLPPASQPRPPVSVIICARNEAQNLRRHLPFFLAQDYPNYEVVVVNDGSSDESLAVLLEFQNIYQTLAVVNLDRPTPPGKKTALSTGIEAARFEILVLSDADCHPPSPHWLACMSESLVSSANLTLGYGPYTREAGWLNRFQRFETVYTAIQYFSFALLNLPYMGVGRNLAYRKTLFSRSGGMQAHLHLASGDDDLFVNQAATANYTALELRPESLVFSRPASSWRGYYQQKRRHLSTGRHYRREHQWLLGLLSLSHVAHYGLGLAVLALTPGEWPTIAVIYLARMVVVAWVWRGVGRQLIATDLLPWIPLLDILYLGYYFLLTPALFTGSRAQITWK